MNYTQLIESYDIDDYLKSPIFETEETPKFEFFALENQLPAAQDPPVQGELNFRAKIDPHNVNPARLTCFSNLGSKKTKKTKSK